jgi:hypothetical protein
VGGYDDLTILQRENIRYGLDQMFFLEELVSKDVGRDIHYPAGDLDPIEPLQSIRLSPAQQDVEPYAVSLMKSAMGEAAANLSTKAFTTAELDVLKETLGSKALLEKFLGEGRMKDAVNRPRKGKGVMRGAEGHGAAEVGLRKGEGEAGAAEGESVVGAVKQKEKGVAGAAGGEGAVGAGMGKG